MSLGRWALLKCSVVQWGNCSSWRMGMGAEVCHWLKTVGYDCWLGFLHKWGCWVTGILWSDVSWRGLGTKFSSIRGYKLASFPWQGNRPGPKTCTVHCLEAWIWPECALNSLVRWGHKFWSADGLCSLFRCHCTHSYWMVCAAFCVLWLGSLVSQAEGYIQWWAGLQIGYSAQAQ